MGAGRGRFASLQHRCYRYRCIATLLANIGHWSQLSAMAWYVVDTLGHRELGGWVQSASMAPVLMFTILAGLLVDRYNGESIQRWTQAGVVVCACILAIAVWEGVHRFWLLALLFMHGVGLAMRAPAWQASLPTLVDRIDLPGAVLLNATAFNLARIVGAALGALLLSQGGLVMVCLVNAALASTLLVALFGTRITPRKASTPARATFFDVLAHPLSRRVACRSLALGMPASAILALLPAHVSTALAGDANTYGRALAWFGAGAVAGGLFASGRGAAYSVERSLVRRTLLLAVAMAGLAVCRDVASAAGCLLLAGGAWTTLFAKINTTLQLGVPDAIRGSALALYITCMFGGMTIGSAVWSSIAASHGTSPALLVAALLLACCVLSGWRWPLGPSQSEGVV